MTNNIYNINNTSDQTWNKAVSETNDQNTNPFELK